jgi:hypothetical protein
VRCAFLRYLVSNLLILYADVTSTPS